MKSLVILALATVAVVPLYSLTLEECAVTDYVEGCYFKYRRDRNFVSDVASFCKVRKDYIQCLENVTCECNLTTTSGPAQELTIFTYFYNDDNCSAHHGELPPNKGVPCQKWGSTTGSKTEGDMVILAISETELVLKLEEECVGFQPCYATYEKNAAVSLYNRNITQFCNDLEVAILCTEDAACKCNGANSTIVTADILGNDAFFQRTCRTVRKNEIHARTGVKCSDDGKAIARTVCHRASPISKCNDDLQDHLLKFGYGLQVLCPALKNYLLCVEDVACECDQYNYWRVFQSLTKNIDSYDSYGCLQISGDINTSPGMQCKDGSGTAPGDTQVVIDLSKAPAVKNMANTCDGVMPCYITYEAGLSRSLFLKDIAATCGHEQTLISCLQEAFCDCGHFDFSNITYILSSLVMTHKRGCARYPGVRENYLCEYGSIGYKCSSNNNCKLVPNSECKEAKVCGCKESFAYVSSLETCKVQGSLHVACTEDKNCLATPHSECSNNECTCMSNYGELDNLCVPDKGAIGSVCSSTKYCHLVKGSVCTGGKCECPAGHVIDGDSCVLKRGYVGAKCSTDIECQVIKGSECTDGGVCGCRADHSFSEKSVTCEVSSGTMNTPNLILYLLVCLLCKLSLSQM